MTHTQFALSGTTVHIGDDRQMTVTDTLPVNVYNICFDGMRDLFWLEIGEPFKMPKKLYGDAEKRSDRILNTFKDRPNTTGVLLEGTKGSGKSLTLKLTCLKAMEAGYPVVLVDKAYAGPTFNKFIQALGPCVLVFDEFEKVYKRGDAQESMLTLLDGVYTTQKLVLMTVNDKYQLNDFFNNRPSRIYYSYTYRGLDDAFIREYCADNLVGRDALFVDRLVVFAAMFREFNFDMLQSLVEEANRYPEDKLEEITDFLNVKNADGSPEYRITLFDNEGRKYDNAFGFRNDSYTVSNFLEQEDEDGDPVEHDLFAYPAHFETAEEFNTNKRAMINFSPFAEGTERHGIDRFVMKDKRHPNLVIVATRIIPTYSRHIYY